MPSDFSAAPPYNVVQPGAYTATDASLLTSPNLAVGQPIPMILGTALGGQPDTALYFSDTGLLYQILKGGAGYDVARFAFDGGAPQVGFVRVGDSITQASLALQDSSSGTVLTLTAQDWGSWANSISVTVTSGPVITLEYVDQLGNIYTEQWDLTGVDGLTVAMIVSAINGTLPGFNGSNYVTATAGTGAMPLATVSSTPLAGGTDGLNPAAQDWTDGLTVIETEPIDLVLAATGDATVHAQVMTHCQNMSAPAARQERVTVLGGVLGETVPDQVTRLGNLPSARVELVWPGIYDYDQNGNQTLYDPFYAAGKVAGMWAAQPDEATSLVHKPVPIVDVEVALSTVQGGPLDQLLAAGVAPIAKQPGGGFWLVDAPTGYSQANGIFRDMATVRSIDYANQYMRVTLETQFVGAKIIAGSQSAVQQAALKAGDDLVTQEIIQAVQTPIVSAGSKTGSWNVSVPVQPIGTTKFIFITTLLQPSSTVQGSTTTADVS